MTPPRLTPRETDLLLALERLTATRGYAPSLREIGEEMGVHRSRAARIVEAVAAKGYVRRAPRVPRSITLTRKDRP